ncbi:ribonucleoside-diphosphate reductase [Schleiferilactobacillus harbinensis]|uniref:ribonucleoside-diphosphate reductase n=1 Tax=Schleiferilactobacillus harbinensis TaxID=304207 RepID=UPI0024314F70|nr:ribonucleoside-diphosphate reductase [Schleiferilactobacillus harbinensis]MCI1850057.1 ribonucleoside-diphosphate reductase [Schleiferilactobacillus harbinensis]
MHNSIHAKVYTKPNCMKCRLTINQLSKVMLVSIAQATAQDITAFKAEGIRSFPVVYIFDSSKPVDQWSDFNATKIAKYTKMKED